VFRSRSTSFGHSHGLRLALLLVLPVLGLLALPHAEAAGASLKGGSSSMARQTRAADQHDFTYLLNPREVEKFVEQGFLVAVPGNEDYELAGVSFPYARPEVKLFVERLSAQHRQTCGEKLVVTSLTRPRSHQPKNAARKSVHQAGMALDLRRSGKRSCRRWLERVLLELERSRVAEANYENRPPHYHVAVFPRPYKAYVERLDAGEEEPEAAREAYRVRAGDTLWKIARRHGTSVEELRIENGLRSSRIIPGQILRLPAVH
jgi:Family of unknown function (DUF5715)/LysM domain